MENNFEQIKSRGTLYYFCNLDIVLHYSILGFYFSGFYSPLVKVKYNHYLNNNYHTGIKSTHRKNS